MWNGTGIRLAKEDFIGETGHKKIDTILKKETS
jgi:hypothetical protein